MMNVYFDNAATTPLRKEVVDLMSKILIENFGNPSSSHSYGRSSKVLLEQSRNSIASILNVSASEIIFTSGGTEADNLILNSCVRDLKVTRIISSPIEHHAVLYTIAQLKLIYNIKVDHVKLNSFGKVDINDLESLLKQSNEKTLVSLMHVNNEIGNMLDIKRVATLCKENNALFHSDTVQSIGHFDLDFNEIPIDFAAVASHKFHGPKGAGFAFIRKNTGLKPLILGGEQERGLRAGTESIHNIVGMAEALTIAISNLKEEKAYITEIKDYFKNELIKAVPEVCFNGLCDDNKESTYTLLNVALPISTNKAMLLQFQLDLKGIACSKGSACQSGSNSGSHVLNAFLSDDKLKKPSIRFSFSSFNTKEEVDYVIQVLSEFANNQ